MQVFENKKLSLPEITVFCSSVSSVPCAGETNNHCGGSETSCHSVRSPARTSASRLQPPSAPVHTAAFFVPKQKKNHYAREKRTVIWYIC